MMSKINKFEYLLEALHKGASQEIHETVHQTVRRRQLDLNIMFKISVFSLNNDVIIKSIYYIIPMTSFGSVTFSGAIMSPNSLFFINTNLYPSGGTFHGIFFIKSLLKKI